MPRTRTDALADQVEQLKQRINDQHDALSPLWLSDHVTRCELDVIGAAILDPRARKGAQYAKLTAERYSTPVCRAVAKVLELAPDADDRAILRAAKAISKVWEPALLARATATALAWHSEYYAARLLKAWSLRDRHRAALQTINAITKSEGLYRWT